MEIYEEFLNKYKKLEGVVPKIKDAPIDANIFWLEDQLNDLQKQSKLKMCRLTRNYIQHNPDYKDFLDISQNMIKFLDLIYLEVISSFTKNNEVMNKVITNTSKKNAWYEQDNLLDLINYMNKSNVQYIPLLSNEDVLIGVFSYKTLLNIISKQITFTKTIKISKIISYCKISRTEVKFVSENDLYDNTLELLTNKDVKLIIVSDTGKTTGRVNGYFI